MTGPEHYKEAEKLLGTLADVARGGPAEASVLAEAQVHATLAHAAATAMQGDMGVKDWDAWRATASENRPEVSDGSAR